MLPMKAGLPVQALRIVPYSETPQQVEARANRLRI